MVLNKGHHKVLPNHTANARGVYRLFYCTFCPPFQQFNHSRRTDLLSVNIPTFPHLCKASFLSYISIQNKSSIPQNIWSCWSASLCLLKPNNPSTLYTSAWWKRDKCYHIYSVNVTDKINHSAVRACINHKPLCISCNYTVSFAV